MFSIPRLTSDTPDLTRAVDLIKKAVDPALAQKLLSAQTVTGIAVTAGTVFLVNHNLGRAWMGVVLVNTNSTATMLVRPYTAYTPALDPTKQLALTPSATGTISVMVY